MSDWHPLVVHWPIVLWPLGVAVDLFALARREPFWHGPAYLLQALATLGVLAALLTGNSAAAPYWNVEGIGDLVGAHEDRATLTLLVFLVTVLGRLPLHLQQGLGGWRLKGWILAGLVGIGLAWATAHLGGELVYERGVGVLAPEEIAERGRVDR